MTPVPASRATRGGATSAAVADGLAAVLAALEAGEVVCPAMTRHRIQGAVLALDALVSQPLADPPPGEVG